MNELDFGRQPVARTPIDRRVRTGAYAVAVGLHVILAIFLVRSPRIDPGNGAVDQSPRGGMVFVSPAPPQPKPSTAVVKPVVRKTQLAKMPASAPEPPESGQPAGTSGTTQSDVPVRLAAGQGPSLLRKVNPIYPRTMEAAGIEGVVVLDAVIHRDGTIGNITVLQASNAAFERSAVEAVRQWRYTTLPFEAIVTVTVNFTQPR
jgi:TonB family protein